MKIQELALIFVIIILPITIVLSIFTQLQIQTVTVQTEYDTKLTSATLDAIKALQINTINSSTSEIANSKIRDVEASVNTFKESLKSTFSLNGYSEEEMDEYIPAIVYTMYDGFYIYSKFQNTNYLTDADGNQVDNNGETISGLKPYISYSARYNKNNIDVVITYALDNFISITGTIDGNYIEESGYLVDGIDYRSDSLEVTYNGVKINFETLEETLPAVEDKDGVKGIQAGNYKYVKFNGTKYYLDEANERVFYFLNGVLTVQAQNKGATSTRKLYDQFKDLIINNRNAREYYKEAYEFKKKFTNGNLQKLTNLQWSDATDYVVNENGDYELKKIFPNDNRKIFEFSNKTDGSDIEKNIENETSTFNQHRLEVIKSKIKTNLSTAIANYDTSIGTDFEMPELTDDEWNRVLNNISVISFVQGIDLGGKVYNGYTIVNNSENKEAVTEEDIYVLGNDGFYHKIGDTYLETADNVKITTGLGLMQSSADGRLNLDFERKSLLSGTTTKYYYPLSNYYGSYNSIVNQNQYTDFKDIYKYVASKGQNSSGVKTLAQAFYTALARERYGAYKDSNELLKTYDIAYVDRGPTSTTYRIENVSSAEYNEEITINGPEMSDSHDWEFDGWSLDENDVAGRFVNGKTKTVKETCIFYPIYIAKKYRTITYNNGYTFNAGLANVEGKNPEEYDITRQESSTHITITVKNKITQPGKHGESTAYTFVNWKDQDGNVYDPGDPVDTTKNMIFTAQWIHHQWKLILDGNGGTVQGPENQTVYVDDDVATRTFVLTAPSRTGYTFLGWYDGNTKVELGNYVISKDVTLQARWQANTYKITLDVNTGNALNPNVYNVQYDSTITIPVATKEGYTFMGWYYGDRSTPETYGGRYTMHYAQDIILVAKWTINKYKLILDPAGDSKDPATVEGPLQFEENYGTLIPLKEPKRNHYEFKGWSDGSRIYNAGENYRIGAKDVTLVAQWAKVRYTLTFNPNGGAVNPRSYTEDYMTTRDDFPYPQREGYTFQGWYDNIDGGNRINSYTFTANKTIYAHWKINQYTVTYNANSGTINNQSQISETYNYGTTIYTTGKVPFKENWKFLGWYDNPSGGNKITQFVLKTNTTLYAHWEHEQITISFNKNAPGSVSNMPGNRTIYKGESFKVGTPSRTDYKFLGWATEPNGSVKYQGDTTYTFKENQTLYAIWELQNTSKYFSWSASSWSAGTKTVGTDTFDSTRYIKSITINSKGGNWGMWYDKYFEFIVKVQDENGNWKDIYYRRDPSSGEYTWNEGKNRVSSGSQTINLNGNYKGYECYFYISHKDDSDGCFDWGWKYGHDGSAFCEYTINVQYK